jgi:2-polyprenyl-3-methyl-5-hydroxy-6-metoxy-1,4-benzoquinol methylase
MLSFHYTLAIDFRNENDKILDIACGLGYGTNIIYQKSKNVVGADIDQDSLFTAKSNFAEISFLLED